MTTNPAVHIPGWFRELPDDALYAHPVGRPGEPPSPLRLLIDAATGECWAEIAPGVPSGVCHGGSAMDTATDHAIEVVPSAPVTACIARLEALAPALQAQLDGMPAVDVDPVDEETWPAYVDPAAADLVFAEPYAEGVSKDTTDDELQALAEQMSEPVADVSELISPRAALAYLSEIRDERRAEPKP